MGEVLEARGKSIDATSLYLEIGEKWANQEDMSIFLSNAGLAFRRGQDYQRAEECYIKALFYTLDASGGGRWDISNDGVVVTCNIPKPTKLYGFEAGQTTTSTVKVVYYVSASLKGLLHIVGYDFLKGFDDHFAQNARVCSSGLKSKFQSPNQAKRVLVEATKSCDVENFRSKIVSCLDQTKIVRVTEDAIGPQSKSDKKKAAREYVTKDKNVYQPKHYAAAQSAETSNRVRTRFNAVVSYNCVSFSTSNVSL